MSSRAVRKTAGHTTQDDLAQVLQKVGLNKHDDEDESDLIQSTTNHRRNAFEMLADENDNDNEDKPAAADSDDQVNGDVQQQQPSTVSKTKRKRKAKKKGETGPKDEDDFLLASAVPQPEVVASRQAPTSDLLCVDNRLLNPLNEMKKRFGSSIVEQIERETNPSAQAALAAMSQRRRGHYVLQQQQQRPSTRLAKQNAFIVPKLGWPMYYKFGLTMKPSAPLSETAPSSGNYFQFEFDQEYQRLQIQLLDYADGHDLQGIMDILRQHPYHIDALIHLSDVSRMQDDTPTAVDLIERALYSLQQSFHPLFSIARGECRLEYRIQENRCLFISLFKNIIYVGERGCTRTALEFCKVLLSLDPVQDPLAILLMLDYYAIRSEEYNYFIRFHAELNQRLNLDGLPNFAFSIALAHFRLSLFDLANQLMQDALLRFPSVLKYLLDKMSVRPDRTVEKCRHFSDSERHETNALKCVQQLYAVRMSNEWKERKELEFLQNNVNEVIVCVERNQDPRIVDYAKLRETSYRKTPINVCRHIVLSESNEIRGFLPNELENGQTFYSFDPFPPRDSIASFQRPERPDLRINSSYNRFGMLLRSLIPGFNLENFLVAPEAQGGAVGGGNAENDAGMLRAIQESIRDFIRDIGVNNPGHEQGQQPPGNGDEGDENDNEFD